MEAFGDRCLQFRDLDPGVEDARLSVGQAQIATKIAVGDKVDTCNAGAADIDRNAIGWFVANGGEYTFRESSWWLVYSVSICEFNSNVQVCPRCAM